jgi:hypothetical protein
MAVERDLGTFIEHFETDNRRRRWICAVAVPLGAIVASLGALSLVVFTKADVYPGARLFPALACGFGLGAVLVGIFQGRLSFTRRDESFAVYEGGLVYACAGQSWVIGWEDIAKVANYSRDIAMHRMLGVDVNYYIKLASAIGGRRSLTISTVTRDAEHLGEVVRRAVHDKIRPKPAS